MIDVDAIVQESNKIEPLPQSVTRLASLVAEDKLDLAAVERVVAFDPVLTARVLRAANSSSYGSGSNIATARAAVLRLGVGTVLSLAIGTGAERSLRRGVPGYGLHEGQLWEHSVLAAVAAECLPPFCRVKVPLEAFSAALLHDIGKVVLGRFLSQPLVESMSEAREGSGLTPCQAESHVLRIHHGEIGGTIARSWKLPERIVSGIIYHHNPEAIDDPIASAVALADEAAKAVHRDPARPALSLSDCPVLRDRLGLTPEGFERYLEVVAKRAADNKYS